MNAAYLGGTVDKENILDSIQKNTLNLLYTTPEMYTSSPDFFIKISSSKLNFFIFFIYFFRSWIDCN